MISVKTIKISGLMLLATVIMGAVTTAHAAQDRDRARHAGDFSQYGRVVLTSPGVVPHTNRSERSWSGAEYQVAAEDLVPLSKVLAKIRKKYPGKQLNTKTVKEGPSKTPCYEVRWLTPDGRRLDIKVDATNGRILEVEGL